MAEKRPWYFRDKIVIFALLGVLALALPMVWFNPHYSLRRKVIVTVIVAIGTWLSFALTADVFKMMDVYTDMLKSG
jgi:hypothetical protein